MNASNRAVREYFDRLSGPYSGHFHARRSGKALEFATRAAIVSAVTAGRSGRLLDCACGSGEVTAAALQSGAFTEATLIDLSPEMLARARASMAASAFGGRVAYVEADIFEYDDDGPFDVILCVGLIAHTGRLAALLRRFEALLAPGGVIVLQSSIATHLGVRLTRQLSARRFVRRSGYALAYFTLDDIRSGCGDAGLRIESTTRYSIGLPFGDRLSPALNYRFELWMRGLAARRGAEAVFTIGRA